MARHFLKLDSLVQATDSELARAAASWLTTIIDPATREEPNGAAGASGRPRIGDPNPPDEATIV